MSVAQTILPFAPPPAVADAAARTPLSPLLKWAGGKRWQLPLLRELWQPHWRRRLVEPFCGGLAVALGLAPARAQLGDANPHLINFYRWVQADFTIDLPMANAPEVFYAHRQRFNALLSAGLTSGAEAASLFYYLNRTGFNGLCRFNRSGLFNVPFGRYVNLKFRTHFAGYAEALAGWEFVCGDFAVTGWEPQDFVYADPPYDVPFTAYSQAGFRWEDQLRLAELLAAHPGPAVLVNQATPRVLELYRKLGFAVRTLPAPRHISCNGDRTAALEVLATRNLSR